MVHPYLIRRSKSTGKVQQAYRLYYSSNKPKPVGKFTPLIDAELSIFNTYLLYYLLSIRHFYNFIRIFIASNELINIFINAGKSLMKIKNSGQNI